MLFVLLKHMYHQQPDCTQVSLELMLQAAPVQPDSQATGSWACMARLLRLLGAGLLILPVPTAIRIFTFTAFVPRHASVDAESAQGLSRRRAGGDAGGSETQPAGRRKPCR